MLVVGALLFGLLGTVLGMLLTFKAIGVGGSSAAEVVSGASAEGAGGAQNGHDGRDPGLVVAYVAETLAQ